MVITNEVRPLNLCALVAEDNECFQSLCSLPTKADTSLTVGASSLIYRKKETKIFC